MRALNLYGINDLRLDELDKPEINEDEVLLKIKACGICSSDEDRVLKTGTYHFPTVPGHEFAGQIVAVGKNVDKSYLGKKASAFPLLPCMKCSSCLKEEYVTCADYKYFGSRNNGAFAEYLAVPSWNIVLLDDSIDYKVGALMEPAAVALHATKIAKVGKGQVVAVMGTGTIGILIGAFCKLRGADVYICGRREESLKRVENLGLYTINIAHLHERVNTLTNNEGMDIVFEAVGSNQAMENAILNTKKSGTIIAVGNPKEDFLLEKNVYWRVLRSQLKIKGTWNSSYNSSDNDWKEVVQLMRKKEFPFEKLITKTYRLEEFEEAFRFLSDKSKPKTKLMFVMD